MRKWAMVLVLGVIVSGCGKENPCHEYCRTAYEKAYLCKTYFYNGSVMFAEDAIDNYTKECIEDYEDHIESDSYEQTCSAATTNIATMSCDQFAYTLGYVIPTLIMKIGQTFSN